MKHLLLTTIAAVLLVGCGESQQSPPPVKAKSTESLAEVLPQQSNPVEAKPVEPAAEAAQPEPPIAGTEAPAISIHDATMFGNIEIVKHHLTAGADVNGKDEDGRTPLHLAAFYGQYKIAELLITKGANMNAKTTYSQTPLDVAVERKKNETAALLRIHGGKTGAELKAEGK